MINYISIVGIIGLMICFYAIYVEKKTKLDKNYSPFCNISNNMKCSVVLESKYSRMMKLIFDLKKDNIFNLPNTYYGVLFYIAIIIYPLYPFNLIPFREALLFAISVFSILLCFLLAFILYFKLRNCCIICIAIYIVNIVIYYIACNELNKMINRF